MIHFLAQTTQPATTDTIGRIIELLTAIAGVLGTVLGILNHLKGSATATTADAAHAIATAAQSGVVSHDNQLSQLSRAVGAVESAIAIPPAPQRSTATITPVQAK